LTLKIINSGPATALRASVTGDIDNHLIVERLSSSCRLDGPRLTCELRELRAGSTRELSASVRLGARPIGGTRLASQFAVTTASTDDPDRSDNDVTLNGRIAPAQLSLRTGVDNTSPRPGSALAFTVVVENANGAGTAADVVVSDRLPAAVELIAAEPSRGEVEIAGDGRVLWSVGELAAGESASLALRVRVRPDAAGGTVLVNQAGVVRGPPATVTGACPGTPQESCSTTDPVPAAAPAAEEPTPSTSPAPNQQVSPEPRPRPSPTTARPSPTPTPTTTPEPTSRIALVPFVPGGSPPGSGLPPLLVVCMFLTSVLVAARFFLFLRR
jgi:large repetitive protein